MELAKDRESLTKLQLEIGKALTGESSYAAEDLSQAIRTVKAKVADAEKKPEELQAEEERKRQGIDLITRHMTGSGHGRRNLTELRLRSRR